MVDWVDRLFTVLIVVVFVMFVGFCVMGRLDPPRVICRSEDGTRVEILRGELAPAGDYGWYLVTTPGHAPRFMQCEENK